MPTQLDNYTTAMTNLKNTILGFDVSGWWVFFKLNGHRDYIYVLNTSSQGYDIQLNGRVCNIEVDPVDSGKIKKLHFDYITGISYFGTNKTPTIADDYVDCTGYGTGSDGTYYVKSDIISRLNYTFNLQIQDR